MAFDAGDLAVICGDNADAPMRGCERLLQDLVIRVLVYGEAISLIDTRFQRCRR